MRVEEQHVHGRQLRHVSMSFEFLSDLGADGGDGNIQGVHLLDLRRLPKRSFISQMLSF